jgi:hypothetical protein
VRKKKKDNKIAVTDQENADKSLLKIVARESRSAANKLVGEGKPASGLVFISQAELLGEVSLFMEMDIIVFGLLDLAAGVYIPQIVNFPCFNLNHHNS